MITIADILRENRSLAPGGWVEIKEIDMYPVSPDDSLPKSSAISRWHAKLQEGAALGHISLRISASDLQKLFQEAGFINVTVFECPLPMGTWPKDTKLKEVGLWLKGVFQKGLNAYSMGIFTRYLNWSVAQVNGLLQEVQLETRNQSYHWYWPL
jgi:hypothetical protein